MTRRALALCLPVLSVLALASCGSSNATGVTTGVSGTTVTGPGVQTTQPPWKPEYAHIQQRMRTLGLPRPGSEKFHIHELLHIYNDGLLVDVPGNIGIDESQHVESALHTHVDSPGVIHMEADKPFSATLGEFFAVWGLALGPDHIGGLTATKDKPLHVFVNGKPITDPAAHVLKKNDNIVIAYGSMAGVPLIPDTTPLDNANGTGKTPGPCSIGTGAKKRTKCFVNQK
jgi:hypothetical protein